MFDGESETIVREAVIIVLPASKQRLTLTKHFPIAVADVVCFSLVFICFPFGLKSKNENNGLLVALKTEQICNKCMQLCVE